MREREKRGQVIWYLGDRHFLFRVRCVSRVVRLGDLQPLACNSKLTNPFSLKRIKHTRSTRLETEKSLYINYSQFLFQSTYLSNRLPKELSSSKSPHSMKSSPSIQIPPPMPRMQYLSQNGYRPTLPPCRFHYSQHQQQYISAQSVLLLDVRGGRKGVE